MSSKRFTPEQLSKLAISSSGIKEYYKCDLAYYMYALKEPVYIRKKSQDLGSVVDCMLTTPTEFREKYAVIDSKVPSGKGGIFLEYILATLFNEEGTLLWTLEDLDAGFEGNKGEIFKKAMAVAEYSLKEEAVWNSFQKTGYNHVKFIILNGKKIIIDATTKAIAESMKTAALKHPICGSWFCRDTEQELVDDEVNEVLIEDALGTYKPAVFLYQEHFTAKIKELTNTLQSELPIHCYPDIVNVQEPLNPADPIIITNISLKTSKSMFLEDAKDIINDYKYYIQQLHERKCILNDSRFKGKFVEYKHVFVFISSVAPHYISVVEYNPTRHIDEYEEMLIKLIQSYTLNEWNLDTNQVTEIHDI